MRDADLPEPRRTEHHPAGYDYRSRFPNLQRYVGAEGGAVYIADDARGHYVISDESTMSEFLLDDDDVNDSLISIREFATRAERDAYCAQRYRGLRTGRVR